MMVENPLDWRTDRKLGWNRKGFGVGEAGKKCFGNPLFNYSILES